MAMDNKNQFTVKAQVLNSGEGELMIYGDIRDERWWDGQQIVVPKEVDEELKKIGNVTSLIVRINSYGGSVTAGQAIIAMINAKKKKGCKVTTVIEGIAASMGSGIAMCGDEIVMNENALMMIHKPSSIAWGNADDFAKEIEILDKYEDTLIVNYMHHFNGTEDELRKLMADESWFTAEEALSNGLCTKIERPISIAASAKGFCFNGMEVPKEILAKVNDKIKPNSEGGENGMFNEETCNQIKALLDSGKMAFISKNADGSFAVAEKAEPKNLLTTEQVKNAIGCETIDSVTVVGALKAIVDAGIDLTAVADGLDALKAPAEDAEMKKKADAFDAVKSEAVEKALTSGVKALGESFDKDRWNKMLDGLELSEVNAQAQEWNDIAEIKLNAGHRFSVPENIDKPAAEENADDYQV